MQAWQRYMQNDIMTSNQLKIQYLFMKDASLSFVNWKNF